MESNVQYSTSKGIVYGLLGGFIGAIILGGIASMMPINVGGGMSVPFFVAAVMMMGIKGSMSTAAGWIMNQITGLIIGAIFGVMVTKVRQLQASNIGRGLLWGAVAGFIAWVIFFIPMANALASSMGMSLMGMGATMIGGSFIAHLIFGLVMGGIVGALLPKSAGSYKCEMCGATYGSNDELMNHSKMHMKSGQPQQQGFKCSACGAPFNTQQELMDHAKKAHPMPAH
jgi:DNA-directed RNA polymerase subunit RPC12/RpoP